MITDYEKKFKLSNVDAQIQGVENNDIANMTVQIQMSSKKGMHWLNDGQSPGGKGAIPMPLEEVDPKDKKSKKKPADENQINSSSKNKTAVR